MRKSPCCRSLRRKPAGAEHGGSRRDLTTGRRRLYSDYWLSHYWLWRPTKEATVVALGPPSARWSPIVSACVPSGWSLRMGSGIWVRPCPRRNCWLPFIPGTLSRARRPGGIPGHYIIGAFAAAPRLAAWTRRCWRRTDMTTPGSKLSAPNDRPQLTSRAGHWRKVCRVRLGLRCPPAASTEVRVFVLVSDGELQEGQTWEAAMFAAHRGWAVSWSCSMQTTRRSTARCPRLPRSSPSPPSGGVRLGRL